MVDNYYSYAIKHDFVTLSSPKLTAVASVIDGIKKKNLFENLSV